MKVPHSNQELLSDLNERFTNRGYQTVKEVVLALSQYSPDDMIDMAGAPHNLRMVRATHFGSHGAFGVASVWFG
jgi:hypothetical protein